MLKPLLIITGPTAVGKTSLSIALAKILNGEIISADSMQVYKYMNIGTAKIKKEEMDGVKHHLIDIIEPFDNFSIEDFIEYAEKAINSIHEKEKLPIIVGGTAFYIQGLLKGLSFDGVNEKIRNSIEDDYKKNGIYPLYQELLLLDPELENRIHINNHRRVIRALEYIKATGKKFSLYNDKQVNLPSKYNHAYIILNLPRETLYKRINTRVDMMLKDGLLKEVGELVNMGLTKEHQSMKGIDYKQVLDYFDQIYTYEEMVEQIKQDTRHFAKRQLTWYKREKNTHWISKEDFKNEEAIISQILKICREVGIHAPADR